MKWGILKWTVGLLLVFGLILATNLIDRNNFNKVADALESIYEDRLVAKGLLFDLALLVHDKEMAIASTDTNRYMQTAASTNSEISKLLERYSETNLTREEEEALEQLNDDLEQLLVVEGRMIAGQEAGGQKTNVGQAKSLLARIHEDIVTLSKIQISEGEREMQQGKAAVESIGFLTQMEIYLLIALGIVIQIVLISGFSSRSSEE